MLRRETKVRLMFMSIGVGFGLVLALVQDRSYSTRIEDIEVQHGEQVEYLRSQISSKEHVIDTLTVENRKMKSQTRVVEKIGADGSIEREIDQVSSSETSKQVAEKQRIVEKLRADIAIKTEKWAMEKRRIEESRPDNGVYAGATSDLDYVLGGKMSVGRGVFILGWIEGRKGPEEAGVAIGLEW